jgi:hypothetical protein
VIEACRMMALLHEMGVCSGRQVLLVTVPALLAVGAHGNVNHHYRRYTMTRCASRSPRAVSGRSGSYYNGVLLPLPSPVSSSTASAAVMSTTWNLPPLNSTLRGIRSLRAASSSAATCASAPPDPAAYPMSVPAPAITLPARRQGTGRGGEPEG